MTIEKSIKTKKSRRRGGDCIYYDWSNRGKGNNHRHNSFRMDVMVNGRRIRKRSKNKKELEELVEKIKEKI